MDPDETLKGSAKIVGVTVSVWVITEGAVDVVDEERVDASCDTVIVTSTVDCVTGMLDVEEVVVVSPVLLLVDKGKVSICVVEVTRVDDGGISTGV